MSNFLKSALEFEKQRLSVIPLLPGQKSAAIKWSEYQKRLATPEEIVDWWHQWPNANVGIVTGGVSNLLVVDLDKYKPDYNPALELEFFETIETPTVETPQGGDHLYFNHCEGITIGSLKGPDGKPLGVDIRGEGGYIVAPPSVNGNGNPYKWLIGLDKERAALPVGFQAHINNNKYNNALYRGIDKQLDNPLYTNVDIVQNCLVEGNRNSTIFTVAMGLARGGCEFELARQTIDILAKNMNPPYDLKEAYESLKSAYNRKGRTDRNITQEVKEYILDQKSLAEVQILTSDCLNSLGLSSRLDKRAAYTALHFFCNEEKLIEKQQGARGLFRIIDSKLDDAKMDLTTEPIINEVNIRLPLDLNRMCVISPGNVIVVTGSKSAGKTALCMNIAWLNQDRFEIDYLNSEAHETEFKKRMKKFGPLNKWHINGYKCHTNFADYIKGDPKKLYIVDYLEIHENFYEIAKPIRAIHEKLGDSVCIIAIQMKAGASLGRGGDFSAEKARLYLTMDFVQEALKTKVTIYDAKEPRPPEENVRGMFQMVKIIEGNQLHGEGSWKRAGQETCKPDKWYQK